MAFNIVELAASVDGDESVFNQRCRFGHLVEGHAVYCHHDKWDDAPRKCRRSWYTNGEIKDEECAGFEANAEFKGELIQIAQPNVPCSRCNGRRIVNTDRGKTETCPLCMGSAEEPTPITLTVYEQDTLEIGCGHSGRQDTAGHRFVRIAESDAHHDGISHLCKLNLVVVRSMSPAGKYCAYLLENTMKGEAVMRQNWKAKKR